MVENKFPSVIECDDPSGCQLRIDQTLMEILTKIERFERAFPDGPEAHRAAHEAMIRAAKAEEDFWRELKLDIAKKGIWGLLVVLCGLILLGIGVKLGLGGIPK